MRRSLAVLSIGLLGAALALVAAAGVGAEVVQDGGLRVSFSSRLAPDRLPRARKAPVSVSFAGRISTVDGSEPPQLKTISLAINRNARLDHDGLPVCRYHQVQPAATAEAIEACPRSVVGKGSFRAAVALPEQSPFPSQGKVVAFNGIVHGEHVIFAHIYGDRPLPQSATIIFRFGRRGGAYGLTLDAELPQVAAEWGHVSAVELTLDRIFTYKGRERSFLSADCPAPAGFGIATAPFAKVGFAFDDGRVLQSTMVRSCRVADRPA
ncbi:MAG TPA: hypothetical protein VMF55_13935 [Solirubrobacterales bacterium]|nr:hypothetical protein [Solirubrobacterales bacterium]